TCDEAPQPRASKLALFITQELAPPIPTVPASDVQDTGLVNEQPKSNPPRFKGRIPTEILSLIVKYVDDPFTLLDLSYANHQFYHVIRTNLDYIHKRTFSAASNEIFYDYCSYDIKRMSVFLACGADVDTSRFKRRTKLMFVALGSNTKLAKFMISKGANLFPVDDQNETILMWAAQASSTEMLKLLLGEMKKVREPLLRGKRITFNEWINFKGMRCPALYWTFGGKRFTNDCALENAKLLLEEGADPFFFPFNDKRSLLQACARLGQDANGKDIPDFSMSVIEETCRVFLNANETFQRKPGQTLWDGEVLSRITDEDRKDMLLRGVRECVRRDNKRVFKILKERFVEKWGIEALKADYFFASSKRPVPKKYIKLL
ncbi:UNVERIFIED_CONTAM: hypothetical protein HDU68_005957, partial [Siphonaria sp. JEL0065]